MIFYNIKELERQLRANRLPQKDVFIYALILLTLSSLGSLNFGSDEPYEPWANNIEVFLGAIITIGFSLHLYSLCKEFNQEDRFFDYYFSIGLVMLVRLFVFVLIISIPLGIISFFLFPDDVGDYSLLLDLSMIVVIGIVYYYLLIRSFNRVLSNS